MPLHKRNESSDQLDDEDLTDELVEWAMARRAAVSETTSERVGPSEGTKSEPDGGNSGSGKMSSGVETAAPIKSKRQLKVLVVALDESALDRAQAHLFDDTEKASRFIETLVESGLNPDRIVVFRGTPMNFNMTYRPVVTIGEPEQRPRASS
jgi:hypothetical protein